MLYLAETSKKNRGLTVFASPELLLLAYQDKYHNWHLLPQPKTISIENAPVFSPRTLITVNIDNGRVVGEIEPAKSCVIGLIRDYLNTTKNQKQSQQEIKLWKQSLEYQAKELEQKKRQLEQLKTEIEIKTLEAYSISKISKDRHCQIDLEKIISSKKLIGEILQEANLISDAQLKLALMTQAEYPELKLGKILALKGWIELKTIDFFVQYRSNFTNPQKKLPLGFYLENAGLLNREKIESVLVEQQNLKLKFGEIAVLKGWINTKTINYFLNTFQSKYR